MKRILLVSLMLALVIALVVPTAVVAANPRNFTAEGVINGIDIGNVRELGHSGNWLVRDRHIFGTFNTGDMGTGDFILTYDGIFALATQAGQLRGDLVAANGMRLKVEGSVAPLEMVYYAPFASYLPKLTITGNWQSVWGLKANGKFDAYLIFVPTSVGHVGYVAESAFSMTGKYTGRR